jgi:hypothetical protein
VAGHVAGHRLRVAQRTTLSVSLGIFDTSVSNREQRTLFVILSRNEGSPHLEPQRALAGRAIPRAGGPFASADGRLATAERSFAAAQDDN